MNKLNHPINICKLIHDYEIEKEYQFSITFPNDSYQNLYIGSIMNNNLVYTEYFIESNRNFRHYYYDYNTNKWMMDDSTLIDWIVKLIL